MRTTLFVLVVLLIASLWADHTQTMTRSSAAEPEVWHYTWGAIQWLDATSIGRGEDVERSFHIAPLGLALNSLITILGIFVLTKIGLPPKRNSAKPATAPA